tara:strand:+ start:573 stop:1778 length:1206 start_codon:yes stop_codon:yes gene_type:complete
MASNAKNLAELLNTDTTVAVADVADGSITTAKLADGGVSTAKLADNAVTSAKALNLGRRNLVFNGGMQIHQRTGTITLGTALTTTLDRMTFYKSHAGTNTVEQSTDTPVGFSNSLKFTTTVADSSVAATDRVAMIYRMEGLDAAKLEFGTSNAQTINISFYVKSSITGTHGGAVGNGSDNRAYPFTYTISSANTWERKSITVAGDTTGTWATNNARSLQVCWGLGVGSQFSGTAGAWEAADRNSATGATTGVLTTANATWFITGIQIEIGSSASDFEHRSFAEELALCQRYYQKSYVYETAPGTATQHGSWSTGGHQGGTSTGYVEGVINFERLMRATPTLTLYDHNGNSNKCARLATGVARYQNESINTSQLNARGVTMYSTTGTAAGIVQGHYTVSAEL